MSEDIQVTLDQQPDLQAYLDPPADIEIIIEQGASGPAGVSVRNVALDAGGNLIITLSDGSILNAGSVGGGCISKNAAVPISGHRMVIIDSNGLVNYPGPVGCIIGMSLNSAATGGSVSIQTKGEITEPSWAWVPDQPFYLGASGQLTQTVPTCGVLLQIGFAESATTIYLDVKIPIILGG